MNYEKIYHDIIVKAQTRTTFPEFHDKHHIIPRSHGGNNTKTNIVRLTLREHFVCHLLLAKIHGKGMIHAALMLSSFKRYNSRIYTWLREKYIKECMLGDNNPARRIPCTDGKRQKCSEKSKGRKWVNNGKDSCMAKGEILERLLSEGWVQGRLMTETLQNGTKAGGYKSGGSNKGVPMKQEQRDKISAKLKGRPAHNKKK